MTKRRYFNIIGTGDIKDELTDEIIRGSKIGDLLNEQYELIQFLKQELFEAKEELLLETADISDTLHLDEDIEELRQEIFGDDKSNKIYSFRGEINV